MERRRRALLSSARRISSLKKDTGRLSRGNSLILHERSFTSSATRGEWDEHHEAVSATLLAPSEDPRVDARDPRWTTRRAVGSPAFPAWLFPDGVVGQEVESCPRSIKELTPILLT